jgi:predicted TPR repeat methyltransferase
LAATEAKLPTPTAVVYVGDMPTRSSSSPLADRRHTYAMAYAQAGDLVAATELMEQALELAPGWAAGWMALGELLEGCGRNDRAVAAYRHAIVLDLSDEAGAAPRLARLGARPAGGALSTAHIAALFDDYAPRFEEALVVGLGYCGPALLREALSACRGDLSFRRMIDLGCGTGLMAQAMAGACEEIVGVDLSARMLAEAERKGVYASVARAEIVAFLAGEADASADLVLAADVLVYLGDLGPVFAEVARVLETGGLFGFTAQAFKETSPARGTRGGDCGPGQVTQHVGGQHFVLGQDLRYAHSAVGIRIWADRAGLRVGSLVSASKRLDAGQPVPGFVAILEKPENRG